MVTRRFQVLYFPLLVFLSGILVTTAFVSARSVDSPPIADGLKPPLIGDILTVKAEFVATMPFVPGPTFIPGLLGPNLGSPVPIQDKLYLIDQNDAIYQATFNDLDKRAARITIKQIFNISEAPDGLALDNRQSIVNVSPGSKTNTIYVVFTSANLPTTPTPLYPMPAPLPGICCDPEAPIHLDDLYRIGPTAFFGVTRTEYQVLYEYKIAGDKLKEPRVIAVIETQSGPTHNGGGMLTLPDGRVLFATGDALPFGAEGRAAAQDPEEFMSKLLIIDPNNGAVEVAAVGVRNVQHMEYVLNDDGEAIAVSFADIGGVTAEEINYISLDDLMDTSVIENFGWGRHAADGLAREGTFYVSEGLPLGGEEPAVVGQAPSPEAGFIQPQAQYGRNDPNGGVAGSGPVTSQVSFSKITAAFSDLASGILYATIDPIFKTNVPILKVNLIDENGTKLEALQDLAGVMRGDPRFFRFPDGSAGVILEATGSFYRLTEVD